MGPRRDRGSSCRNPRNRLRRTGTPRFRPSLRRVAYGVGVKSVHKAMSAARSRTAEIVVVDDASTDDTGKEAAADGAKVIRQEGRRGPLAAWLRGVNETTAQLLLFVDADCQVDEGAIK